MSAAPEEWIADDADRTGFDVRMAAALASAPAPDANGPGPAVRHLIAARLDRLPLPGSGATLQRWRALERVARHDLALVKLYESHVDALAILAEIEPRSTPRTGQLHAVWASESRDRPITIRPAGNTIRDATHVVIDGRKTWCSGARVVDTALMTATDADGARRLVEVRMSARGITVDDSDWNAVGMRDSQSLAVVCNAVPARLVGGVGSYLDRPGFWHGGAGVAACWYGAAAAVGQRVRDLQVGRDDVHALAHVGTIDALLAGGAALLREAAAHIDAYPAADAGRIALRVRGAIADLSEAILHHAMRALGPGPLCNEPDLARRVADLPVFVRQSRAEHDLVAQARMLLADSDEMNAVGWRI